MLVQLFHEEINHIGKKSSVINSRMSCLLFTQFYQESERYLENGFIKPPGRGFKTLMVTDNFYHYYPTLHYKNGFKS
jgi:hypothetical protein